MRIPSPLDNALASATTSASTARASRSALALGTVGQIGEELINCLLESPAYSSVSVGVEAPLRSVVPRLQPWQVPAAALADLARVEPADIELPRVDHVFCCISDARSYFKRDQAYVQLRKEQIPALARLAAQRGAKRFILLAPLSAFLQLSASAGGLIDVRESDLTSLGFEALIIVRPTADYATAQGNVLERLIGWGAKAIMQIMIPQRLQPLRARQIAQAAVNAASLLGAGIHIVGAHEIAELAAPGTQNTPKRMRL
jgi:hypothetical protein